MGATMREKLKKALAQYMNAMNETLALEVLDERAGSSLTKVNWNDVVKMGDQVSWQATVAGMLWTGDRPEVNELEENMAAYFNILQGFLLLSHGSKVGAGPTLSSSINTSLKEVVDRSFLLYKESIAVYGFDSTVRKNKVPQLVGPVWNACTALKKTPTTNIRAIGRAMNQVAVSVKDVLREMNELKPASADSIDDNPLEAETASLDSDDDSLVTDLGDDLSPEEMNFAQLAIEVVSSLLVLIEELICSIKGLIKLENQGTGNDFVDPLETLLRLSQRIGEQVDELGPCLYPPQEFSVMKVVLGKLLSIVDEMKAELGDIEVDKHAILEACSSFYSLLKRFESELDSSTTDALVTEMQKLNAIN